jgi:hypothetical protein
VSICGGVTFAGARTGKHQVATGKLMSLAQFIRSRFTCYLTGGRPDYASAVTQGADALRPQVKRLQELISTGEDPGCVRDPQMLCGLHGFVGHYATRYHLKSEGSRLEATSEVLTDLFGPETASEMIEVLEPGIHEPAAAAWIRDGAMRAELSEQTGAALIGELIDERVKTLTLARAPASA